MSARRDEFRLPKELQLAAVAAGALAFSLFLPWYQKSVVQGKALVQGNVNALGVFTWVEAAILLVCVAVLFLVWARWRGKGFHLPGGDGVAIMLAGGWAVLLIVWRMFDRPEDYLGIQWGMFASLLAAGALIAAGARVRALHAPEPPNPAADEVDWVAPPQRERERPPDRRPRDATAVTQMLRERPEWEGEPPDDPSRAETKPLPEPDPSEAPTQRRRRPEEEQTQRLWDDTDR